MKRGDVVTVAIPGDYGKPRPSVVVQSNFFNDTHASVLVCPFTSAPIEAPIFRIPVAPTQENGLRAASAIMVDKVAPIRREKIGPVIGKLDRETVARLNRSLALFLGLVG